MQDLHRRDGIRWSVGSVDGRRSSTWRLWGDKKGDTYLAMRGLGGQLKVSIHRDRRCSVGFTKEFEAEAKLRFGAQSRHWERWKLPDAPFVRAVHVRVPDSELALFPAQEANPMAWIPAPGSGRGIIFTVFVAEPASALNWETPEKNGNLLGIIECDTRATLLVHHNQLLDEPTLQMIQSGRQNAIRMSGSQLEEVSDENLHMVLWGLNTTKTELFFFEIDASNLIHRGANNP